MATAKSPALLSIIKSINKQSGEDIITIGGAPEKVASFSTGSALMDYSTGCNGVPIGRLIEIYGDTGTGKTSLSIYLASLYKELVKTRTDLPKEIAYIDLERTTTRDYIESFGLDGDEIIWAKPKTASQAFESMLGLAKSGEVGLIILDSVDAAQTEAQIGLDIADANTPQNAARQINLMVRNLSKIASDNNVTVIFINQIRDKISMMGPAAGGKTTSGGKAIPFYTSLRIEMLKRKPSTLPRAYKIRYVVRKSKFDYVSDKEIEVEFFAGKGIDPVVDLIDGAKMVGIAAFAGPTFKAKLSKNTDAVSISSGGLIGVIETLRENSDLRDQLRNAVTEALKERN